MTSQAKAANSKTESIRASRSAVFRILYLNDFRGGDIHSLGLGRVKLKFFVSGQRNGLVHDRIRDCKVALHSHNGNIQSNIDDFLLHKIYQDYFAVHDGHLKHDMHSLVAYIRPRDHGVLEPPREDDSLRHHLFDTGFREKFSYDRVHVLRDYFGEEYGYMFAWAVHHAMQMYVLVIAGLIVVGYGILKALAGYKTVKVGIIDNDLTIFFGIFINLWFGVNH
jgi:hypothetical protein